MEQQESMDDLQRALLALEPDLRFRDEIPALRACELALQALLAGGYGVGALVLDSEHRVWGEAGNAMLAPALDSAGHAEMRALTQFEQTTEHPPATTMTLLATLEPCPMCLTRALYAGVGEIAYLVEDGAGGMVHCRDSLPPALREWSQAVHYRHAEVSDPLRELAQRLAYGTLQANRAALLAAHRGELPGG